MKLCSSLLLSVGVTAQYADDASDRWGGSYDYVDAFNYGKNDGGLSGSSGSSNDEVHLNGLICWSCEARLDLGNEAETASNNAYARCLNEGRVQGCVGEQRTCLFEERRRMGVVYSVSTGCKQTDACLALWRRNQRFTLPFMNFGDMSLRDMPTGKPIYVDDECTTYGNTNDETGESVSHKQGGLSYAKFSIDTSGGTQENTQMSQWESACRWCCAAKNDQACNVSSTDVKANPFKNHCNVNDATAAPSFGSASCSLSNTNNFFLPFNLANNNGDNPQLFIDTFIKTAMTDLMSGSRNPVTGEGRNSLAMDKYKYRGNSYAFVSGKYPDHVFEHQSDMPSQENRDFFDQRISNPN